MEEKEKTPNYIGDIDNKYNIIQIISYGTGEGDIYLVHKKSNYNNYYVAKIPNDKKGNNTNIENEIVILKTLNEKNCLYIIKYIDDGEGPILIEGNKMNKKYLILEYAPKYSLGDYLNVTKIGFGERFSKLIFYKICKGIKIIHDNNLCHIDIKPSNILMDDNFNPKIADFGFASKITSKITEKHGTPAYAAPELLSKFSKNFFPEKLDIFSLGITLIELTTGLFCFQIAKPSNKYYSIIYSNDKNKYWEQIIGALSKNLTNEFEDLCLKMIDVNPEKRFSINDVLNHKWLEDIKNMDKNDKLIEYEEKIRLKELFEIKVLEIKESFQKKPEPKKENEYQNVHKNPVKGESEEKLELFKEDIIPKYIELWDFMNYIININISIKNPKDFMNSICNLINGIMRADIKDMIPDKENAKIDIIFEGETKKEEKQEEKELKESEDEDEDEESEEDEKIKINELTICIQLFKTKEGHLLRFIKSGGNKKDFFEKYEKISELIVKLLNN